MKSKVSVPRFIASALWALVFFASQVFGQAGADRYQIIFNYEKAYFEKNEDRLEGILSEDFVFSVYTSVSGERADGFSKNRVEFLSYIENSGHRNDSGLMRREDVSFVETDFGFCGVYSDAARKQMLEGAVMESESREICFRCEKGECKTQSHTLSFNYDPVFNE